MQLALFTEENSAFATALENTEAKITVLFIIEGIEHKFIVSHNDIEVEED